MCTHMHSRGGLGSDGGMVLLVMVIGGKGARPMPSIAEATKRQARRRLSALHPCSSMGRNEAE